MPQVNEATQNVAYDSARAVRNLRQEVRPLATPHLPAREITRVFETAPQPLTIAEIRNAILLSQKDPSWEKTISAIKKRKLKADEPRITDIDTDPQRRFAFIMEQVRDKKVTDEEIHKLLKQQSHIDAVYGTRITELLLLRSQFSKVTGALLPTNPEQLALISAYNILPIDREDASLGYTFAKNTSGSILTNSLAYILKEAIMPEPGKQPLTPDELKQYLHTFIENRRLFADLSIGPELSQEKFRTYVKGILRGAMATAVSFYQISKQLGDYNKQNNTNYQVSFPPKLWVDLDLKADLVVSDPDSTPPGKLMAFVQVQGISEDRTKLKDRQLPPEERDDARALYVAENPSAAELLIERGTLYDHDEGRTVANTHTFVASVPGQGPNPNPLVDMFTRSGPGLNVFDIGSMIMRAQFATVNRLDYSQDVNMQDLLTELNYVAIGEVTRQGRSGQSFPVQIPPYDHYLVPITILKAVLDAKDHMGLNISDNPLVISTLIDTYPAEDAALTHARYDPERANKELFKYVAGVLRGDPNAVFTAPKKK